MDTSDEQSAPDHRPRPWSRREREVIRSIEGTPGICYGCRAVVDCGRDFCFGCGRLVCSECAYSGNHYAMDDGLDNHTFPPEVMK